MQRLRQYVPTLLLLIYFLAVPHQLIPHPHHEGQGMGLEHHADHVHEHGHAHEGLNHQDHHDRDILDFLLCLLTETEHDPALLEYQVEPLSDSDVFWMPMVLIQMPETGHEEPAFPPSLHIESVAERSLLQSASLRRGPPAV